MHTTYSDLIGPDGRVDLAVLMGIAARHASRDRDIDILDAAGITVPRTVPLSEVSEWRHGVASSLDTGGFALTSRHRLMSYALQYVWSIARQMLAAERIKRGQEVAITTVILGV